MLRAASGAYTDTSRSSSASRTSNVTGTSIASQTNDHRRVNTMRQSASSKASDLSDTDVPESEMVEENHWWPRLGEVEIELARQGKRPIDQELY